MKLTPSRPPTIASASVTTRARSGTSSPCLSPWRAAILPAAYPPMRKAKSNVISSPIRAVVPPSVKPWRPAVPKIAPTIPLTMPLRMRPAPRAASHPRTTLTQLVPRSSPEVPRDELLAALLSPSRSLLASPTMREAELPPLSRPASECVSPVGPEPIEVPLRSPYSVSTLGTSVLPSLCVIRVLLSWWSCRSALASLLRRALGLGHGAVVEQSPKHPSDDRPKDVEPHATEVPRNQHRPQRASRVDRPAGHWPRDEHSDRKREPDSYGSYRSRGPLVRCYSHNHEHQYEGDQDLYDEGLQVSYPLCGVGGSQLRLTPCACSAEGHPGGQSREHRPNELSTDIVRDVHPGELLRGGHPQGYGRIDVRPRDVSYGGNHGHQCETEGERHGQRVVGGPGSRARKDRTDRHGRSAEDQ